VRAADPLELRRTIDHEATIGPARKRCKTHAPRSRTLAQIHLFKDTV
jgi:hypothetical protein